MERNEKRVIARRNELWEKNPTIPTWVNKEDVGLDQFFTNPEIAKAYFDSFIQFLEGEGVDIKDCIFIEPSAGDRSFYDLLPKKSRIGLDIMPLSKGIQEQDFLSWKPRGTRKKRIFIGNPPFGYRAWLALAFMNHAAKFADYIGFILPMAFQSEVRGGPRLRVEGMKLRHSEIIPTESFYNPNKKAIKINALWQVWEKGENVKPIIEPCDQWMDIFTVDLRTERLCGQTKMDQADYFIQRTYYNIQSSLVKSFDEVKYCCGYGLIIKKQKRKILSILNQTNWDNYSNLTAHNCRHISMYHIQRVLTDRGLTNA